MQRKIIGFHQDSDGVWVADLECTHDQHVRHNPPWQERAWAMTEIGRQDKLGAELDCVFCNMAIIPHEAKSYKQTTRFTETTVPPGLLRDHRSSWSTSTNHLSSNDDVHPLQQNVTAPCG